MDAITALTTRASAFKLTEPAPSDEDLKTILEAAVRAPDHGRLRPWRFLVIRGDAREKLGRAMADVQARENPEIDAGTLARTAAKPMRAPLIVAVVGAVDPDHPKIPEIEQVLSAGAAAQNIMLAAHALGYGCMWKTGGACYDDRFKSALGLKSTDHIVALLYLGTVDDAVQVEIDRPDVAALVKEWQ